jgi:hypothetical protein
MVLVGAISPARQRRDALSLNQAISAADSQILEIFTSAAWPFNDQAVGFVVLAEPECQSELRL